MANNEIDVAPEEILAAIHQHLSNHFFEAVKVDAKQTFNQLQAGKGLPLIKISAGEFGDVIGILALDSSEFVGKLNFTTFRDALASHLNRIAEKLKSGEKLNILTSEETGSMLFHIPGLVQTDDQVNILVTAIEQSRAGEIIIKLMFLDPANYANLPPTEAEPV